MALKDIGRQRSRIVPAQGLGWGILEGFSVDTPASLNPAITTGKLLLPGGTVVTLSDSDFSYIGPAGDGLISDDDITSVFFSPSAYFEATGTAVPTANSGAIYSNLTGTKTNPNDIRLYTATAASGSTTKIVPGDWYDTRLIQLTPAAIDTSSAADKSQCIFPGVNGRAAYCVGLVAVTTASVTNDTATVECQSLDLETGAETVLGTVVVTVKSLDLDVLANIDWSELTSYKVVQPMQPIVTAVTDASTAGNVIVYGLFGGYPSELFV